MSDESGVLVYPRLQVPKGGAGGGDGGRHEPTTKARRPKWPGRGRLVAGVIGGVVIGALLGFAARSYVVPPAQIGELEAALATAGSAAKASADKIAFLEKEGADQKAAAAELEKKLATVQTTNASLQSKAAEVDKKAAELAATEQKLKVIVDKNGTLTVEGDEIHLQLVDKVLFKLNDDQLTDQGKALIEHVADALKDIPDKQVYVQGHTDDQPIFNPPPPKPAPLKKGQKPPPPPPPPRFATNWELSAARALTVVHYLQDVGKIEPSRLAALAFGQYRPVSRTNKALNRRIEIVLYPKRAIVEKK